MKLLTPIQASKKLSVKKKKEEPLPPSASEEESEEDTIMPVRKSTLKALVLDTRLSIFPCDPQDKPVWISHCLKMESVLDTNDILYTTEMGESNLDEDSRHAARKIFKRSGPAQAKEDQKKLHTMLVLSMADTCDTLKCRINRNDQLAGTLLWYLFVNAFEPKMPQVIMALFG